MLSRPLAGRRPRLLEYAPSDKSPPPARMVVVSFLVVVGSGRSKVEMKDQS
jgi:hypothetical protein